MTTAKYKECSRDRAERLRLGKPHIHWGKREGEWFPGRAYSDNEEWSDLATSFCVDQDVRWTPRSQK